MEKNSKSNTKLLLKNPYFWCILALLVAFVIFDFKFITSEKKEAFKKPAPQIKSAETPASPPPQLDFEAYDKKLNEIANNPIAASTTASSTKPALWPIKTVYPNYGALLPFNRIVAYYGNLYSTGMGVLGEYPENEMLDKLSAEVNKWQAADPNTPVIPALHYIAVVAQAGPGRDDRRPPGQAQPGRVQVGQA